MKESAIEKHLRLCVKMRGGMVDKFTSPGKKGPPDDLVTWPDGVMQLVECKTIGGRLSQAQKRDHARRARRRVAVRIVWTLANVEDYVMAERKHWYGQILIPQCPENLVN